jgi:hypothetical protein
MIITMIAHDNARFNRRNMMNTTTPLDKLKLLAKEYPERAAQIAEAIFKDAKFYTSLETMSNKELADLLLNHVWADMNLWTEKAAIVEAAISRLKGDEPQQPKLDK